MLFNSYEFLLFFLPIVWGGYFLLGRSRRSDLAHWWLLGSSLFFYSWGSLFNLLLISTSILGNYWIGTYLRKGRFPLLLLGLSFNIGILGYFKYVDFIIENLNLFLRTPIPQFGVQLPLGISFFTFQQIAYLVDRYYAETEERSWSNYALFVSFFPQLIAGPIVHHRAIVPQFCAKDRFRIKGENITHGLLFFSIGMGKKVLVADSLSEIVSIGFGAAPSLSFLESWATSIFYTTQLYFDFSGYSDMAVGLGRMFNIQLPFNFLSPYKAENIQDFWRRWHVTLGEFLREYLYIPLGGSRIGDWKKYRNILTVFTLGGLWHGAGWTYIFWGILHGTALVIYELWKKLEVRVPSFLAWGLTFVFCNVAWVFFRAESWEQSIDLIEGMVGLRNTEAFLFRKMHFIEIGSLLVALKWFPNTKELVDRFGKRKRGAILAAAVLTLSLLSFERVSEFIYFNF